MYRKTVDRPQKLFFSVLLTGILILSAVLVSCEERKKAQAGVVMPYNRVIRPAGKMIFFGDSALENHALGVVLSPCGRYVAVEERFSVVILDVEKDSVVHVFSVRQDPWRTVNTYGGIQWSRVRGVPTLFWGARNAVFRAAWDGERLKEIRTYRFDPRGEARASLPNGIVVAGTEEHLLLYVVLNGNDRLVKLDPEAGRVLWEVPVGLAPYGVVLTAGKLYVTNWSGSVPADTLRAAAGIPWGKAYVDPVTGAVSSGTVSVVDTADGRLLKEIVTGLHPNDIVASPDGRFVYVANGNEDYVSVISTQDDEVTEKISIRLMQQDNPWFGDTPSALAITSDGHTLYVGNGMDNALAVVALGKEASSAGEEGESRVKGFIPTGTWPGGIALAEKKQKIYVADIEALGARIRFEGQHAEGKEPSGEGAYNSHRMMAAVSVIAVPEAQQLESYTQTVKETNHMNRLDLAALLPREGRKPVPVPERVGEPSVFKHVIYIIKENRTYDQVLGDVPGGDGDPSLCAFGAEVTPNMHKLVKDFQLMDHYEASGKCSAEGHLWTDASIVTDYIEKNVRAWFRSYTHVLYDAMAYPKTGFLWDNALDHGKKVVIYGEAAVPVDYGNKKWADIYQAYMAGEPVTFRNKTTIDRVRGILSPSYPAYDSHNFPDIMRADAFIRDLHRYEQMEGDQLPDLMILALPNDHTAGTSPVHPTPRAMVADNDLALGRIIEELTRSRFWKNTVVFVTEDDSQAGWDHLSAYRTVGIVISPYSRLHKTVTTPYNQTSTVRTIEQILGLPPMNIADATAEPMFDVFTATPDFSPYLHEENRIPLDEMNPPQTALTGKDLYYADESARLAARGIDAGEDDLMNRIIWHSFRKDDPYPEHLTGDDPDDD